MNPPAESADDLPLPPTPPLELPTRSLQASTLDTAGPAVSRSRGREPLPMLPRWESETRVEVGTAFEMRSFAPWPRERYDEPYIVKNVAASIVDSDPREWLLVTKAASTAGCCNNTTHGRRGSEDVSFQPACECWTCELCAIQKAVPYIRHAHCIMRAHGSVFVGTFDKTTFKPDAVRKQVSRGVDFDFPGCAAWGIRVDRSDGSVTVYASCPLTVRSMISGEWMDACDAFEHFRSIAMRLPGIERAPMFFGFAQYRKMERAPSQIVVTAPRMTLAELRVYRRERDSIATQRHGEDYQRLLYRDTGAADQVSNEAYWEGRKRGAADGI